MLKCGAVFLRSYCRIVLRCATPTASLSRGMRSCELFLVQSPYRACVRAGLPPKGWISKFGGESDCGGFLLRILTIKSAVHLLGDCKEDPQ